MLRERPTSPSVHHLLRRARRRARRDCARRSRRRAIETGIALHAGGPRAAAVLARPHARGASSAHAEAWAREELSLPMFAELRDDEVDRVAEACVTWAAGYST